MDRRKFVKHLGLGLAAGWAFGKLPWPLKVSAADPDLRLALLADAHLKNGDNRRPEAQALARAVMEINALAPPPDLVIFAGDLAHKGRPDALDLGREILSDLSPPLWAVRGEGDTGRGGATPWVRRFGQPRFSRTHRGFHFLGLDTTLSHTPKAPAFGIGYDQRQWLARELAGLDDFTPLVIVSHAPLGQLFHPWQQWTEDAPEITPLLSHFRRVLCLHGHVHEGGVRGQGSGASNNNDWHQILLTENRKPKTENHPFHISLPAIAWPLPQAVQGTPTVVRPGLGPRGCGWALLSMRECACDILTKLWQA